MASATDTLRKIAHEIDESYKPDQPFGFTPKTPTQEELRDEVVERVVRDLDIAANEVPMLSHNNMTTSDLVGLAMALLRTARDRQETGREEIEHTTDLHQKISDAYAVTSAAHTAVVSKLKGWK